jgi:hypothetical protein
MKKTFKRIETLNSSFALLTIILVWVISVSAKYLFHGMVYEFDYGIFQPDGVYYTLRTYMFMGVDINDAATNIAKFYSENSTKKIIFDPTTILPENNNTWGLVYPRILYPLLSVPFVYLLGIKGMLVIPALSLFFLMYFSYRIVSSFSNRFVAIFVPILISSSPTIMRWMFSNCTDSLFTALFAYGAFLIMQTDRSNHSLKMCLVVVATNLTRIAFPIWGAISLVMFIKNRRKLAGIVFLINLVTSLPTFLLRPSNAVLPRETDLHGIDKFLALPLSFLRVTFYEFAELFVLDRLLACLIIVSILVSLYTVKNEESLYLLGVTLAVFLLGAINGSIGVNFRYQLPVIPFAILSILAFFKRSRK